MIGTQPMSPPGPRSSGPPPTGFDWRWNFRRTQGFPDPPLENEVNTFWCDHTFTYPYQFGGAGGILAGWIQPGGTTGSNDATDTNRDLRVSGSSYRLNAQQPPLKFRIDVTGDVMVTLGAGEQPWERIHYLAVYDGDETVSTPIFWRQINTRSDEFLAADGNVYTRAAWLSGADNESHAVQVNITESYLTVWVGDWIGGSANYTTLAHVRVRSVP